jgi:hypothetical protein
MMDSEDFDREWLGNFDHLSSRSSASTRYELWRIVKANNIKTIECVGVSQTYNGVLFIFEKFYAAGAHIGEFEIRKTL